MSCATPPPTVGELRHIDDWDEEEDGTVLWWKWPIDEPPYVGSPLWGDWPGYHEHWMPLPDAAKLTVNGKTSDETDQTARGTGSTS